MADRDRMIEALKAADAAGDTAAATQLATAIRGMQTPDSPQSMAQQLQPQAPQRQLAAQPVPGTMGGTGNANPLSQWPGRLNDVARGFANLSTFGQGDRIAAGAGALTGVQGKFGDYSGNLAQQQATTADTEKNDPVAYNVGGALGVAANPANRLVGAGVNRLIPVADEAGNALKGLSGVASRYGNAMTQGGVIGGGYGAGLAEPGHRVEGALKGTAAGMAGGAVGRVVADVGGAMAGKAATVELPPAQSEEGLRAQMQAGYKASEDAGAVVTPEAFKEFVDDLPGNLKNYRARLAPETTKMLEEFQSDAAGGAPKSFADLDELRQLVAETAKGEKPNEIRLMSQIKDHLDTFMNEAKGPQLLSGDSEAAMSALNDARANARAYYKMRNINDIVETGENLNDQNWVKNQFRSIVRNQKKFDQYSDDEQKIISDIAKTGNLEKAIKLIPWRGVQMASTYAEPMMQGSKIGSLQDLIARGGARPTNAGAIFGHSGVPALSGLAAWPTQRIQLQQANAQR